ncbi:unnamed protein product [Bathycoccus prasinos]
MFYEDIAFNQNISGWNLSQVTIRIHVHKFCEAFCRSVDVHDRRPRLDRVFETVTPIPGDGWHYAVAMCLAEELLRRATWGSKTNHGVISDWNTSLVTDMSG